ncbi:MAG: fimbrial biogenesis chaperone [Pseudomonadota bacterium]|uniref:fimbrial biogenesis chaperone n=1 Tax=Providencia TaxID=586 RepID=UPI00300C6165
MKTIGKKIQNFQVVKNAKQLFLILLFSLTSSQAISASGGVGLNATRVVYHAESDGTSIGARNNTNINYLAKFSVTIRPNMKSDAAPFMVTPPLAKIDSGKTQEIKINAKPYNFPTNRESLFYFNSTMIPATNGPTSTTAVNIGYTTIIKLFYRPKGLKISPQEASEKLRIVPNATGITVYNDSPYYISLAKLSVNNVKINLNMKKNNTMIAPFDSFSYITPVSGRTGLSKWSTINDLGGEDDYIGQVK